MHFDFQEGTYECSNC